MTDNSGNIVNTYDYDIYGNITQSNEKGMKNPIKYAGQYYDSESDQYHLRARYYDPELMRFISEDTNKGDVKYPLSLNLYIYCYGNPLKYYDPSGHTGELAAGWFGSMWWLLPADGPIPIGDAIYVIGGGIIATGEAIATYGPMVIDKLPSAIDAANNTLNYIKEKLGGGSSSGSPNDPNKNKLKDLPKQLHHFLTNKSKTNTKQFIDIVRKYKLDLNDTWNTEIMDHLGRHANAYHEYMLEQIKKIDFIAKGNNKVFLKLFDAVKQKDLQNPEMLKRTIG